MHRSSDLPFLHYRAFNGGNLPKGPVEFLFRFIWTRFRFRALLLILGSLGGIGLMTAEPVLLRDLVETLRKGEYQGPWAPEVWTPFLLMAGAWLVSALFNRLREIVEIYTVPNLSYEVRTCLFSYLIEHSPEFFHATFSGRLAQKVVQAGQAMIAMLGIVTGELVRVFAALGIGILLVGKDFPTFILVMLAWTICFLTAAALLSRRCLALSRTVSDQVSTANGVLVDIVSNSDLVRAFARAPYECGQLAGALSKEVRALQGMRWFVTKMWSVLFTAVVLFQIIVIAMAVHWTETGRMVVGDTVMMVSLSVLMWTNIWGIAARMMELMEQFGALTSALDSIVQPHAITDATDAKALVVGEGAIVMEGVGFAHTDGTTVFDGLDLHVRAGERIGLVGPSGAGKSTLVRLIRRHYQPQQGRIFVDGQDIALVTQASLNQAIAEVPQQPGLFHRSVADNIRYARFDAAEAELMEAAGRAHCHAFVERRPEGYDTLVGENGVQLSGGERQRVAIARALLKDSRILILDEATSALDSQTEHDIQEALWELFEGRTVIAIAHRLSTIARMDRILYLERGRILEQGSHEELLAKGGAYARMWERQVGGFIG